MKNNKKKGSAARKIIAKKQPRPKAKKTDTGSQNSNNNSNQNSKVIPLGDRILIKPFTVENTEGKNSFGIIIPDTVSKEHPERGQVLAVGEGRYENGKLVPIKVRVGDKVIFSKYGFDEVKVDEDNLYILKEDSILAIVK